MTLLDLTNSVAAQIFNLGESTRIALALCCPHIIVKSYGITITNTFNIYTKSKDGDPNMCGTTYNSNTLATAVNKFTPNYTFWSRVGPALVPRAIIPRRKPCFIHIF